MKTVSPPVNVELKEPVIMLKTVRMRRISKNSEGILKLIRKMKTADIRTPISPKIKEIQRRETWIDLYFADNLGDIKLTIPTGRDPKIIEAEYTFSMPRYSSGSFLVTAIAKTKLAAIESKLLNMATILVLILLKYKMVDKSKFNYYGS